MKRQYAFIQHSKVCLRGLILLLAAGTVFSTIRGQAVEHPTVLILVRHAEKKIVPPENKDPDISPAGQARAEEIARMFSDTDIKAIYATQYKRTQQTAKPLADKLGLPMTTIEAKQTPELVKSLRAKNAGQVVFIVGHNNTVPEIIAAMGGPQMPIIPETEYDNLFILTVHNDGKATLVKMKYGSAVVPAGNPKHD
jgi:broad specificity phosphatase PhoE